MSTKTDKVLSIATKRGFIWQSYEIYGGTAGFYDLGPLGVRLKQNIVELWRKYFVKDNQEFIVEIETPIIAPAIVFRASGHEEHFTDYAVECTKCRRIFRADHLVEEKLGISAEGLGAEELSKIIKEKDIRCPICGGELGEVEKFQLLFSTYIGPYSPENLAYLRPETAQGMFVNFKRVYELMRRRMPIGIAQIGRVARNEISPRQGPIRLREFTIMEIEFFYDPENPQCDVLYEKCCNTKLRILTAEDRRKGSDKPIEIGACEAFEERVIVSPWLAYWMCIAQKFIEALGVPSERTYFEEKLPSELAHYSKQTFDQIVILDKWGKLEVSGHAYRYDYDLRRHIEFSNQDLYALRQLKEPRIVKKIDIKIDKNRVLTVYRDRAKEIFRVLATIDKNELLKLLSTDSSTIVIHGVEIPRDVIKLEEVEEKIHIEKFIPHVAEPSFGAERLLLVALEYAYREDGERAYLAFPVYLAPIQVAVLPLLEKEPLIALAKKVYRKLIEAGFYVYYDESGSIGRRYMRCDEIGIPFAVTIDFESLENNTVTVRERDSRKQIRVPIDELVEVIDKGIKGVDIFTLGYPVIG